MSNKPLVSDEECLHCKAEPAAPKPNPKLYQRIEEDQPSSNFGKALTLAIGTAAIGIVAVTIPFVIPAFRKHALPYIPATDKQGIQKDTYVRCAKSKMYRNTKAIRATNQFFHPFYFVFRKPMIRDGKT
jgi:hypothetical protein